MNRANSKLLKNISMGEEQKGMLLLPLTYTGIISKQSTPFDAELLLFTGMNIYADTSSKSHMVKVTTQLQNPLCV